jgi:hypothetical protein
MQIQPAYSQAEFCGTNVPPPPAPSTTCITQGQNPTQTTCLGGAGMNCSDTPLTHQQASQAIRQQQSDCRQGILTGCTVTPPTPP